MTRVLTWADAAFGLLGLAGATATLAWALVSFFDGYTWQPAGFAGGALCLGVWSAVRLEGRPADHRA